MGIFQKYTDTIIELHIIIRYLSALTGSKTLCKNANQLSPGIHYAESFFTLIRKDTVRAVRALIIF